jgi:cytoskeleton-associated protein 5
MMVDEDLDPRAFAEPVDLVGKVSGNFNSMVTSSKWKERKEALDDLFTVLNSTPRIKEAPELGDVAKILAQRIQSDANINCVMIAANCLEALAKGLGTPFSRYREVVIPLMLERMKERKTNVTEAIGNALDAIFVTVSRDLAICLLVLICSFRPSLPTSSPT